MIGRFSGALFLLLAVPGYADDKCPRSWCGPSSICCGTPTSPPACPFANPRLCAMDPIPPAFSGGELQPDGTIKLPLSPVVALESITGNTVCSGTLIADNKVLTASHCFCETEVIGLDPSAVVYGVDTSASALRFKIDDVTHFDPTFCEAGPSAAAADLAIVTIDQPEELLSQAIAGIDLDVADYSGPAVIAGFGVSDLKLGGGSKEVYEYQDVDLCDLIDAPVTGCRPGVDLLARVPSGEIGGGCQGDSGAAIFGDNGQIIGVVKSGLLEETTEENEICGNGDVVTFIGQDTKNAADRGIAEWISSILEESE